MALTKFGKWSVVSAFDCAKYNDKVLCQCECGTERMVLKCSLITGKSTNCGCTRKESLSKRNTTHGQRNTNLYNVWRNMRSRCYDPKTEYFARYGGRGISVCDEWRDRFEPFYEWSKNNGWLIGKQIDRINNNGNYEPSNCRFVSASENCRNRSSSKLTESDATAIRNTDHVPAKEIAKKYGISRSMVRQIKAGQKWTTT